MISSALLRSHPQRPERLSPSHPLTWCALAAAYALGADLLPVNDAAHDLKNSIELAYLTGDLRIMEKVLSAPMLDYDPARRRGVCLPEWKRRRDAWLQINRERIWSEVIVDLKVA